MEYLSDEYKAIAVQKSIDQLVAELRERWETECMAWVVTEQREQLLKGCTLVDSMMRKVEGAGIHPVPIY